MNTPSTADDDLLRLEQLLDEPVLESAMRLDEAQGYLCAALSGPQPVAEEQWLPELLGGADAMTTAAGREASELFRRFATQLREVLASGQAPILLLYGAEQDDDAVGENAGDDGVDDYLPWCMGYLRGVDTAPVDWFDALGAQDDSEDSEEIEYLDEQLFTLFMLTGDAEAAAKEAGEEWPLGRESDRLRAECEERLPQVVSDIYRFWHAWRGIETIRRQDPKTGRNDPCPCGSGNKYKKCCGAA